MNQIKYTKDHPAFQRTLARIEAQIENQRPGTIHIAMMTLNRHPALGFGKPKHEAIAEIAYRIELSMLKRLCRYYGLAGKYVAH